jgi:hypothetical protein
VIVRETDGGFVVFEQHEHALVSGELARRWNPPPSPFENTIFAIAHHDVAWRSLDGEIVWDRRRIRPVSFTEFAAVPKVRAYADGVDWLEARDPYAACLSSMHYATVVGGSGNPDEKRFARREMERQDRLKRGFCDEELENLERNLGLLKLCDGLSLFVCLNEPGRTARLFPPYEAGFALDDVLYQPGWADEQTLIVRPSPFEEDFDVSVPYTVVDKSGERVGDGEMNLQVLGRESNPERSV